LCESDPRLISDRKLNLLYVANDVMQNAKKKDKKIVDEWARALPSALKHYSLHCDDHLKGKLDRILSIWEERQVFSAKFVAELKGIAGKYYKSDAAPAAAPPGPDEAVAGPAPPPPPPTMPAATTEPELPAEAPSPEAIDSLYEAVSAASAGDQQVPKPNPTALVTPAHC